METNRNSYQSIFKAIGLFGGTKVFQILIGIIKNKFIAVLLGPVGMGISGLITSNTSLVKSVTGLGLRTTAVREMAKATGANDSNSVGRVAAIMRYLVWFTGLLGTLIVFIFAKQLSILSFGEDGYTWAFQIVSIILLIDQVCEGQAAIMQGTFHYRYVAASSLWGSVLGLALAVPMYYLWGMKAIVPAILANSVASQLPSWYFRRKVKLPVIKLSLKEFIAGGRMMIILGVAIALTAVLREGKTYVTRIFISATGSISDVGLYTAAITIATQYINVILNAMGSDYSPRLAAMSGDKSMFNETINRQSKLMLTIITPVILAFIVFIKPFTILLYSQKFVPITGMIEWIMLGMFFRATSWCLSYTFVARGEPKLFFWNEFASTVYSLGLFMLGYKFLHFDGIGVGYCLSYIIYTFQVYIICRKKFDFAYTKDNITLILIQLAFTAIVFIGLKMLGYTWWRYLFGSAMLALAIVYTYKKLDEMIPVKQSLIRLKVKMIKPHNK